MIEELLKKNGIEISQIESRTKEIHKFTEKIERKGYKDPFNEVDDLTGIRIIAYYLEDIDPILDLLKKEFSVDPDRSIDKAQILDPDRFGYLSVHYILKLSSIRNDLSEWEQYKNLRAEIQVRTVLQHAWGAINRKLAYERFEEVPKNLRRQLYRLSALLELGDIQFSDLRNKIERVREQYSKEVDKGELDIEIDSSSIEVYFSSKDQVLKWQDIAENAGIKVLKIDFDSKPISSLIKIVNRANIKTIRELDSFLSNSAEWGKDFLSNLSKKASNEEYTPSANIYAIIALLIMFSKKDIFSEEGKKSNHPLARAFQEIIQEK